MKNNHRIIIYAILTAAVMIMIFAFSSQDGTNSSRTSQWLLNTRLGSVLMTFFPRLTGQGPELDIRKYAHMAEYALLAVPAYLLLCELNIGKPILSNAVCCVVFCYLYACSDEFHQAFVPGRSSSVTDTLMDLAGTVIGLLTVLMICSLRKEAK